MNKKTRNLSVISAVVLLLLVIIPMVLKKQITRLVVNDMERVASSEVHYKDLKVRFFKAFPHVFIEVDQLKIVSSELGFITVEAVSSEISFKQLFDGQIVIKSLNLHAPDVHYLSVNTPLDSTSMVSSTSPTKIVSSDDVPMLNLLTVDNFSVTNGHLIYETKDIVRVELHGVDAALNGTLSEDSVHLDLDLKIAGLAYQTKDFSMDEMPLNYKAQLVYVSEKRCLSLADNSLQLGKLHTSVLGSIIATQHPVFDLTFAAPNATVDAFLALFPKGMIRDVDLLQTEGNVAVNGFLKGTYMSRSQFPAFGIDVSVAEAWFKYTHLDDRVDEMTLRAHISHPDQTDVNETTIAVDQFSLLAGKNKFTAEFLMTNPVMNTRIKGHVMCVSDLASLAKVFPMKASTINGEIDADVVFDGQLADVSNENYEAFNASGHLELKNYYLKSKAIPQGLKVSKAVLKFTPERINLNSFQGALGNSDVQLKGYLSHYFAYLFDNKTLKGELVLSSKFMDINEFNAPKESGVAASPSMAPTASSALVIPQNIQFHIQTNLQKVVVDDMVLSRCVGVIRTDNGHLFLDDLHFNTLDGKVVMTGEYNTLKANRPMADLQLDISNISIEEATQSLSVLRQIMPLSQTTQGRLSSKMDYFAEMDSSGQVDLMSVKAKGNINSSGLRVANNSSLNKLADQLKDDRYRDITTSPITLDFTMADGKMVLAPFNVKIVDKVIDAGGWYTVDNRIDFSIRTTVKAKEIGGDVSKYIGMVSDVNKPLPVTILLTGDASDPTVKYDTREAINILRKDVTKNLNGDAVKSILKNFF